MPYSGPNDPELPDYIQELEEGDREQWVAIFNDAFEACMDDDGEMGECEGSAFAQANGVVLDEEERLSMAKGSSNLTVTVRDEGSTGLIKGLLRGMIESISRTLSLLGGETEERAINMNAVYYAVWDEIERIDYYAWLNDLYMDDDGMHFAVYSSGGKLYRADVMIGSNGSVELGEPVQVMEEFVPVGRTKIFRQADGKWRWFSISATSVLNRAGEIDSRDLFDSFIANAQETGDYPMRQLYHLGEETRTGMADYLARDDNVFITSGLYDDPEENEWARFEIEARQREPDTWGESIGFRSDNPELYQISDGITIPVYKRGVCVEMSTVLEDEAASWFTHSIPTEVKRMNDKIKGALMRLAGEENAEAVEALAEKVDNTNRSIVDNDLITRSTEDEVEVEVEVEEDEEEDEAEATAEPVVEITDEVIEAIAQSFVKSEVFTGLNDKIGRLADSVAEVQESIANLDKETGKHILQSKKRLDKLERDDDEKKREWQNDLPKQKRVAVTYRPRTVRNSAESEDEEIPMSAVAEGTLANMPS